MSKIKFKQGPRFKFKDQVFWAEGGLVCIENQLNGDFKALTRAEAAARAIALNAELQYCTYPDERDELCNCVRNLCEVIKEGKRQGDPTNPEVRRQMIKDSRKVSLVLSASSNSLDRVPPSPLLGLEKGVLIGPKSMSARFKKLEI